MKTFIIIIIIVAWRIEGQVLEPYDRDMEIVAFLLNIVNNFDFGQNLTMLANALEFLSKAISRSLSFALKDAGYKSRWQFPMQCFAITLVLTLALKVY